MIYSVPLVFLSRSRLFGDGELEKEARRKRDYEANALVAAKYVGRALIARVGSSEIYSFGPPTF